MIRIRDVPTDFSDEEIKEIIGGTIKYYRSFFIVKKNEERSVIFVTEPKEYKVLIEKAKIIIGFNRCKIEKYVPVIKCYRCQGYGHFQTSCRKSDDYCKMAKEQIDKNKCINYQEKNKTKNTEYKTDHFSESKNCSLLNGIINRIILNT